MTIKVGDRMPSGTLLRMGADGPEPVEAQDLFRGRRVAIFGLPGAFTGTCSTAHVPSFIRTRAGFAGKGVDEVVCLSVNDPFVMGAWGESTGATAAGIAMLGDPSGDYVAALGLEMTAPAAGLYRRCRRFAALVEDGVVAVLHEEPERGCTVSSGEALLAAI